jgi:hypothetical protein
MNLLSPDEIAMEAWAAEISRRRALLNDDHRRCFDLVSATYPQDEQNLRLSLQQLATALSNGAAR